MSFSNSSDNLKQFNDSYAMQLQSVSLPERLNGSYHLRNCLKQSACKEIYLLEDEKKNLFVLKKAIGKQLPLIKQEYQIFEALKDISGLAVPKCIDYWIENDTGYLLRTYIEGRSLADFLDRQLYLSDLEITNYMLAMCDLIGQLHTQSPPIIHRDIKPENFIIQKGTGTLYLIDFDTARLYVPDKSRDTHLIGTPSHAAPEQFGFLQSNVRTDIYAMGKTLMYLSCGNTEMENLKSSSVAKPFQKIILRCTDFTPKKRYSSMKQVAFALKRYRNRLVFPHSNMGKAGIAILFLVLGIGLGYAALKIQGQQNAGTDKQNAYDSEQENNLGSDGASEPLEENDSSDKIASVRPAEISLLEQSGTLENNLIQFQDMADQIILDYYSYDLKALAEDCEKFVNAFYQDDAIMQIKGTDYAGYDEVPDKDLLTSITRMRDALAYREQILKRNIGNYADYKDAIYYQLFTSLDAAITNKENALYTYATTTGEAAMDVYPYTLLDIMTACARAFDMAEGIDNPL